MNLFRVSVLGYKETEIALSYLILSGEIEAKTEEETQVIAECRANEEHPEYAPFAAIRAIV